MDAQISDEYWKAIVENDAAYDQTFYYGVKTTGIFCRPSCKSRVPNKDNVCIFDSADQALSANFRPCKRCKPNGLRLPDEEWILGLTEWMDKHYHEPLSLSKLAEVCHGSPFHLQRTFKRIMGISPNQYIEQLRMKKAADYLINTDKPISTIGPAVGYNNVSYFVTLFKKNTKQTPRAYRKTFRGKRKEPIEC
ncbi:bifunctional transcriptional activator/DNA repair enzyme AdaA [Camelliibacillus cellulosilyticus]|uniref:Bifunctional transcriptional activator/DNA repair enzyme AdaA n=1 Tax=Camelliibacillus cellulosilyticus TaxID=2174486 RepID=A0ABV9GLD3_9BACL